MALVIVYCSLMWLADILALEVWVSDYFLFLVNKVTSCLSKMDGWCSSVLVKNIMEVMKNWSQVAILYIGAETRELLGSY